MIIGITGTLGAGKGTIVEYLVTQHHFRHYSVRGFLVAEINKRGLPVNRDSMTSVANELRAAHSPAWIVEELYRQASQEAGDAIIESLRTPGEIEALRHHGDFYLFAVDCDIRIRYQRISERKSETDNVSFETFAANEKREMQTEDPAKQNLAACLDMADFTFDNSGSIKTLHAQIEEALDGIHKNQKA